MKKGLIVLIIIGLIVITGVVTYNGLVSKKINVETQWAQVENVYQRRADLIPNLVNTVKGYADFEKSTLTEVVEARAKATSISLNTNDLSPQAIAKFQKAQGQLSGALSKLLVTVERYPDLKANQNFLALQSQLEGTENRIAVERKKYNEAIGKYNKAIRGIPGVFLAGSMDYEKMGLFEAKEGADQVPEVKF